MKIIASIVCFVLLTFFVGSAFAQGTQQETGETEPSSDAGSVSGSQDTQQETGETGTLTVLISGFKSDKGSAKIALCNSNEDYKKLDNTFKSANGVINNRKSEWIFPDLPFGTYAVRVFHDENNNGKLDKNAFGAPKEKYGYSNNARAPFGPPTYEKAQFTFKTTDMSINIIIE